jgi:hypothetical protein
LLDVLSTPFFNAAEETFNVQCIHFSAACAVARQDEAMLVQQAASLTDSDRMLLKAYHHSFDDDLVDLDLALELVLHVHCTQPEGKHLSSSFDVLFLF